MKKNKITGLIGTIVLHAVLLILLLVIAIRRPADAGGRRCACYIGKYGTVARQCRPLYVDGCGYNE